VSNRRVLDVTPIALAPTRNQSHFDALAPIGLPCRLKNCATVDDILKKPAPSKVFIANLGTPAIHRARALPRVFRDGASRHRYEDSPTHRLPPLQGVGRLVCLAPRQGLCEQAAAAAKAFKRRCQAYYWQAAGEQQAPRRRR